MSENKFSSITAKNFHLHFGHLRNSNGEKIHPDEIVNFFKKSPIIKDLVDAVNKMQELADREQEPDEEEFIEVDERMDKAVKAATA